MSNIRPLNIEVGKVAYFVHLHLDTAHFTSEHQHRAGHLVFDIEGKARPMLVLAHLGRSRGRTWFLTCLVTSKANNGSDHKRQDLMPIGTCITEDKDSFVDLTPLRMPDNLIHRKANKPPQVKPVNPLAFQSAVKVILHKVSRYPGVLPQEQFSRRST